MRYLGSKGSVVETVYELVSALVPKGTFCDPFGGIGVVASRFKRAGYSVWTGDVLHAAHCFQVARIGLSQPPRLMAVRRHVGLESRLKTWVIT